jgi:hypothetical protein
MQAIIAAEAHRSVRARLEAALGRPRRVVILLLGVVVLSVADLLITLAHLRATGMAEANPVARFVIGLTGSPISLACFKALSVFICVGLLYKVRKTVQGEIASWCALLILSCISMMWFRYAHQYENPVDVQLAQSEWAQEQWVRFD